MLKLNILIFLRLKYETSILNRKISTSANSEQTKSNSSKIQVIQCQTKVTSV